MKLKALYDFNAQPGSSELSIHKDEVLTLLNKDIGDGWYEGINSSGDRGLFPAGYVEPIQENPPVAQVPAPPPPKPPHLQQVGGLSPSQINISFFNTPQTTQLANTTTLNQLQSTEEPDWPDEDWDDEDDSGDNVTEYSGPAGQKAYALGSSYYNAVVEPQTTTGSSSQNNMGDINSATANLSITEARVLSAGNAKSRKNFNKFSNFVKTGVESFLLEARMIPVPHENVVYIQYDQELGIIWKPNLNPYTCAVTKHGKETKMKGLKTYISYDITPSTSNIVVRRRYKHFDWLLQRLEEKFMVTPLPPLPEKQIAGRFQEDFVEHRRNLLQLWVNYITRHPVLSQCDVWWHFMTCSTDDMKGWKLGKRKAEKDELLGLNFFFSIDVNPTTTPLDPIKTTKQIDNFQRFVAKFDEAVKHMFNTAVEQSKKFSTIYSKDYKKLSESIKELSSAFQSGTAWRNTLGLNEAIRQTSAAYEDISRLFEEEPKYDFEPMADILHQYRGLLSGWPEILQLHRNTINTRNEQEKLLDEGKIRDKMMAGVNQRANVVTYAILAEINHFHNERLVEFKQMMQVFLKAQISFHTDILGKLNSALSKINDA